MDIETTGLNRRKNMIYLIGLLYKDDVQDKWILKQYFSNTMDKEKEVLEAFMEDISTFHQIITYNGDSFDLPFINHRLKHYKIDDYIDKSKSFDLYRIIRSNRNYLNLKNLKLKTIEESLGFFRGDVYSGFECIKFYYDYTYSQNKSLKDFILKHNYDDLIHMLDIISILDVIDDKKSFSINIEDSLKKINIEFIENLGDMLILYGNINSPLNKDIRFYGSNYSLITKDLKKFELSLETKKAYLTEEDKCIYIDLLDFENIYLQDKTKYPLPENIYLLTIENMYCVDNIKNLSKEIFRILEFQ